MSEFGKISGEHWPLRCVSDSETFYELVDAEREYQINKWGDDFDARNTRSDWLIYIVKYIGFAHDADNTQAEVGMPTNFERMLVKIATLCMAAFEWSRRMPPRHFD